jgi:hypothetical protein
MSPEYKSVSGNYWLNKAKEDMLDKEAMLAFMEKIIIELDVMLIEALSERGCHE